MNFSSGSSTDPVIREDLGRIRGGHGKPDLDSLPELPSEKCSGFAIEYTDSRSKGPARDFFPRWIIHPSSLVIAGFPTEGFLSGVPWLAASSAVLISDINYRIHRTVPILRNVGTRNNRSVHHLPSP